MRGRKRSPHSTIELQSNKPMTSASVLLSAALLAANISPAVAETNHRAYLASVSTYRPMAGFNHVVGPTRFAGYFLSGLDSCRVTVLTAAAHDEALVTPPRRIEFDLAAGGRTELPAGDGWALAIACTADADLIKVAPQRRPITAENRNGRTAADAARAGGAAGTQD
jgi:hypothetical protein